MEKSLDYENHTNGYSMPSLLYPRNFSGRNKINVDTFNNCLNHFMDQLENTNETYQFYEYFKQYYFFQKQLWAMCYHQQAGINTNMYVEHFHRILKYIYMKGVTNK